MSKDKTSQTLRSYPAPWKGELLLYCTKCTKKLKKSKNGGLNVRKWMKARARKEDHLPKPRVLGIPCVKMCPKGAITVATQDQLGRSPAEVSIVRSEADLEVLYELLSA